MSESNGCCKCASSEDAKHCMCLCHEGPIIVNGPLDVRHHFAGDMDKHFAGVVVKEAEKQGRTFCEQLIQFAIDGAEHSRLCTGKNS